MGGFIGKPQKTDSEVKAMADNLFNFMYTQYDINEIWDIAEKPNDYILELSELIHHHFTVIGYTGGAGERGEIYVKRIDDYKKQMTETTDDNKKRKEIEREERRRNAQTIAFFFVRIFQILGTMLLIIRDTHIIPEYGNYLLDRRANPELPRIDYPLQNIERARQEELKAQVFRLQKQLDARATSGGRRQKGGALSSSFNLGSFECFRNFLSDVPDQKKRENRLTQKIIYSFTDNLYLAFDGDPKSPSTPSETQTLNPKFVFLTPSKNEEIPTLSINTLPSAVANGEYPINSVFNLTAPSRKRFQTTIQIDYDTSAIETKKKYKINDPQLKDMAERSGIAITSISRFLELYMMFYLDERTSTTTRPKFPIKRSDEEKPSSYAASRTGSLHYDKKLPGVIKSTYEVLLNKIGHSHCKRRALQLLDAKSILYGVDNLDGRHAPTTDICAYSAPPDTEGKSKTDPVSLSEYKPTEALAQLFGKITRARMDEATTVLKAFVREKEGADVSLYGKSLTLLGLKDGWSNEESAMAATLQRLSSVFDTEPGKPLEGFKDLKISRSKKCKTNGKITLASGSNVARELRRVAQQLIDKHNSSIVYITEFLEKTFSIDPATNKVSGIKESILILGLSGLDALTDQARALATNYYMDCEIIFKKGVEIWETNESDTDAGSSGSSGSSEPPTDLVDPNAGITEEGRRDADKRVAMARFTLAAKEVKQLIDSLRGKPAREYEIGFAEIRSKFIAAEQQANTAGLSKSEQDAMSIESNLTQQEIDTLRSGASAGT